MIPLSVLNALVKAGVVGAVLGWALWENSRDKDRLFTVVENNTAALVLLKSNSCADICREAAAVTRPGFNAQVAQ